VARLGAARTTFAPHFLEFFGRRAVDLLFLHVRVNFCRELDRVLLLASR